MIVSGLRYEVNLVDEGANFHIMNYGCGSWCVDVVAQKNVAMMWVVIVFCESSGNR